MTKTAAEKMRDYRKRLKQDPVKYDAYLTKARERKSKNYTPVNQLSRADKKKRRDITKEYVRTHRNKTRRKAEVAREAHEEAMETSGYETSSSTPLVVNMSFPNRRNGPRKRISKALAKRTRDFKDLKLKYAHLEKKLKTNQRSLQRYKKKQISKTSDAAPGCSFWNSSENELSGESVTQHELTNANELNAQEITNEIISEHESTNTDHEQETTNNGSQHPTQDIDNLDDNHSQEPNQETLKGKDTSVRTPKIDKQEPSTPNSKTNQMLKIAGLNKKQRDRLRKPLLLGNVLQTQIMNTRRVMKQKESGSIRRLIGAKILSKYRLGTELNKSTGIGRNRIGKGIHIKNIRRERELERNRANVLEFLSRDDNSRCNPGKQDKLKVDGESPQTRVLTDYLKHLYTKFLSENPGVKLSLASFCRIRPANIKLTRFISRSCCLCTKHQNFALCTQALRKCGVNVPLNPEKFIEDKSENVDKVRECTHSEITFGQWKRVAVDDKGKRKMIMKVISMTMEMPEFLEKLPLQVQEFSEHVKRVCRQHEECRKIKQNLPLNEVVLNMDFAENYACKSVEEIQSAYWNMSAVTLHPIVVYYKEETSETLKHQSIVMVSDEMAHNSNTVLTFIDKVIPEIKKIVPTVQKLHYFTDSPTSQYRNKTIFRIVSNHDEIYGCSAIWSYYEAGHGKGPCDGLGGTVKRMADEAVKSGKVTIQDAEDFFRWTQSESCTMKSIHFMYVSQSDCQEKANDVNMWEVKPVKGTMKLHTIVGKGNNMIITSSVSCYCTDCLCGNQEECKFNSWTHETLNALKKITTNDNNLTLQDPRPEFTAERLLDDDRDSQVLELDLCEGDFVAATYDKKVYIGKILQCDNEDGEVEITFMQNARKLLQWPKQVDKIWVDKKNVICKVSNPIPTGKSKRMFKLNEIDWQKIDDKN